MKPVTNDFKNTLLKFGREYKNTIGIYDYDVLATEDNNYLVTEDDRNLIARMSNVDFEKELDDEDIFSIKLITKGDILSTMMKELDFETPEDLEIGRVLNYKFALKTRSGKNLCGIPDQTFTYKGISVIIKDGEITLNGTATGTGTKYLPLIKTTIINGNYVNNIIYISGTRSGGSPRFNIRKASDNTLISGTQVNLNNSNNSKNFSVNRDTSIIFGLYISSNSVTFNNYKFKPQLVEGNTADYVWEKYGAYDYIDYGKFVIYKKEYDEVTENYTYTCYDFMLKTMRLIGSEFRISAPTITGVDIIKKVCNILSLNFDDATEDEDDKPTPFGMIGHKEQEIKASEIIKYKLTYRDLLDLVCQYFGVSMYMENNELKLKLLGNIEYNEDTQEWFVNNDEPLIVDTLNAEYLKDSNISFKNKYGKINALEITGIDESKQQYVQDSESVSANGLTLFTIQKNILFNDTSVWEEHGYDITQDIFKMIDGIDYELNDISTNGVLFLDWLDFYNIEVKGTTYKCLLLNSEIAIKSGIEENIYTEIPNETAEEYTSNPSTRDDIIADSIRARGNVYATNVEASGRIDAKTINATSVGAELEEVIRQISPGGTGSSEIIMVDPDEATEDTKLFIDEYDLDFQGETNDIYSTDEIKTNKIWIDGKSIYRKVTQFTINATSTSLVTIDLGIPSTSTIIKPIKIVSEYGFDFAWFDKSSANMYITTTGSNKALKFIPAINDAVGNWTAIIEYTKAS